MQLVLKVQPVPQVQMELKVLKVLLVLLEVLEQSALKVQQVLLDL